MSVSASGDPDVGQMPSVGVQRGTQGERRGWPGTGAPRRREQAGGFGTASSGSWWGPYGGADQTASCSCKLSAASPPPESGI